MLIRYAGTETEAVPVGTSIQVDCEIFFDRDLKIYLVDFQTKDCKLRSDDQYDAQDMLDQNWSDLKNEL